MLNVRPTPAPHVIRLDTGPPLTLDTRAAKDRQAELVDAQNRYGPSFWTLVALAVFLTGVGLWILLNG